MMKLFSVVRKLLVFALVAAGLTGGAWGLWQWRQANGKAPLFRTEKAARGSLVATIGASGTIVPEEVVDVGAQVAGQIKTFGPDLHDITRPIDYTSHVEENTVLARLDDAFFRSRVEQSKANLLKAEADVRRLRAKFNQAERVWKRVQTLNSKRVVSDEEYDTARAAFESAEAELAVGEAEAAQARAALKEAEINLGYCTIRSPVKGVIVDRRVNIGQTVVASLNAPSLFLIAKDLKRLQVSASVNEADIGNIHVGQQANFTVDTFPTEVFTGQVAQIRLNATMNQNVVTYTVMVNTDNSSGRLIPYLTANLQFRVDERSNALLVPNAALRWRPERSHVLPSYRDAYEQSLRRRAVAAETGAGDKGLHNRGTVWVEEGPSFVAPVRVRTGLTDGNMTEIVEILKGDLEPDTPLVVGVNRAAPETTGSVNPLAPQVPAQRRF